MLLVYFRLFILDPFGCILKLYINNNEMWGASTTDADWLPQTSVPGTVLRAPDPGPYSGSQSGFDWFQCAEWSLTRYLRTLQGHKEKLHFG